ncbi:hypothetical protein [Planctomicrobium sp. SH527]|uniref:hypothetical protein n=1 Tax=Planctomicrobium sp. SH527 TaxID=3448123 RepID=UPI003F5B401B
MNFHSHHRQTRPMLSRLDHRQCGLSQRQHAMATHPRRGGAVIIVVLTLLTTLTVLGLFFYNWTTQEVANAQNFAESDVPLATRINPNPIFDKAAEQLIVGTSNDYPNSSLWGGMHSMLAHQIGRITPGLSPTDSAPRTGQGILIRYNGGADGFPVLNASGKPSTATADFRFHYNAFDGSTPANLGIDDFILNYSKLAQTNRSYDAFHASNGIPLYHPDVDYTYPDHNTLFLAHESVARVDPTDVASTTRRVLIPSFFRPQLFPDYRSDSGTGNGFISIYTDANRRKQVFRPHREHRYPDAASTQRYLTAATSAQSGDRGRILEPFPFPDITPVDATRGRLGVFTHPHNQAGSDDYSLLDLDLDGDNIKDAIFMDLDLPMIELSGGRQVIPLASFKVLDADGLLNLNTAGNQHGVEKLGRTLTGEEPFSVSNLGMSRSEINPTYALNGNISALTDPADRTKAMRNSADAFGYNTATAPTRTQLGNMELRMMMTGWRPSTGETEVVGRYGDRAALQLGNFANIRPGAATVDDDGDNSADGGFGQQMSATPAHPMVTNTVGVYTPGFVHPLSPIGLGLRSYDSGAGGYLIDNSNGATRRLSAALANGNPAIWVQYENFQPLASTRLPAALMTSPIVGLNDEEDETILEPGNISYGEFDTPYEAADSAFLQLSDLDLYRSGTTSRLSMLASANFVHVNNASEIRKRFTTNSWDRLDFGYTTSAVREWEWGDSTPYHFPPEFGVGAANEPFRPEIRVLMRTEFDVVTEFGANRVSPRHRLQLNKILSNDSAVGGQSAFVDGSPRFRNLMPHPTSFTGSFSGSVLDTQPIPHGNVTPAVSFAAAASNPYAQEWWARYDRQRLARDIYCLLWLTGSGNDGGNLSTASRVTPERAREMAQFAVNIVDAVDRDSNITEFYYDSDLSNGWDTNVANLSVVYGVEHQQLAFNEVLFIRSQANKMDDIDETEYDDSEMEDQYHSFVELRNAAPWAVNVSNSQWRIRRVSVDATGTELYSAVIRDSAKNEIPSGGEYLISCQGGASRYTSGGAYRPSDFRFNHDGMGGSFKLICPNYFEDPAEIPTESTGAGAWLPKCDLDLMHADHSSRVTVGSTSISMVNHLNATGQTEVRLVLERRMVNDPDQSITDPAKNPWIEVDRIQGTIRTFDPENPATTLDDLRSQERREPFDSGTDLASSGLVPQDYNGSGTPVRGLHSMPFLNPMVSGDDAATKTRRNARAPTQYTIWQPHFDRDLSSTMELLSIPLFGNYCSAAGQGNWNAQVFGGATKNIAEPEATLAMTGHRAALMRIYFPQGSADANHPLPSWYTDSPDAPHYQNRWYRLLEFVDVKSQDQLRSDAITALQRRTPGKINLNTVRSESVFAGLIDDPHHIDPRNPNAVTVDKLDSARRWYREHSRLRDGADPFLDSGIGSTTHGISIPGGFRSRPYRAYSYLDAPNTADSTASNGSVQSTLLRHRPGNINHGLLEASRDASALDQVDYHTRQRILAKIANNSTNRSHVFFVWIGLDFFDAHINSTVNAIQIGGPSAGLPRYRLFCVVDMSRLEEGYDPSTNTFDFRKFIIHRQLLP